MWQTKLKGAGREADGDGPVVQRDFDKATGIDELGDATPRLPFSDWVRIWLCLRARHLPSSLAQELQISITETTVRVMLLISLLAVPATAIVTVAIFPLGEPAVQWWIGIHVFEFVMIFTSLAGLRRSAIAGTLTTRRLNLTMLPSVVLAGVMWGVVPAIVGTEQIDHFYLATAIAAMFALVGFFWPLGHWPLSVLFSGLILAFATATYWSTGQPEALIFSLLAPTLLLACITLSGFACYGLTVARYYIVVARERQQLIGLLLQDFELGDFDFLWESDADLSFTHVPARMRQAAHGDPRIAVGQRLDRLFAPSDPAFEAVSRCESFETRLANMGDDRGGELHLWGRPKLIGGRCYGYRGVGSDEAAKRVAAAAERAQERLDAMVTLTSGLAHDFNNQLATVLGAAELAALEPDLPASTQGHLRRAIDACLRTRRLTSDLVVASGYDATYRPTSFQAFEAVEDAADDVRSLYPGINITTEHDGTAHVHADRSHFTRAIRNLIENACQALQEYDVSAPTVHITTTASSEAGDSPGQVTFAVQDNGPGIPAEMTDRLFEPFFSTRRGRGGSGLGLAVARGFALQASGTLTVEPSTAGARFQLTIPVAPPPLTPESVIPPDSTPVPTGGPLLQGKFLVVDDDVDVAQNIAGWIETFGTAVEVVHNVEDAMRRFEGRTDDITCVISDLILPDGEGFDVVAGLRRHDPTLRAVYMSGFSARLPATVDPELRCPFLAKPFSYDELLAALKQAGVPMALSGSAG